MNSSFLSAQQVSDYHSNGFVFPLPCLSPEEATRILQAVEHLENSRDPLPNRFHYLFNCAHLVIPEINDLVQDPRVLDPVESILGPDLLLWSTNFFIKEAETPDFVSWHQDLRYWGLDDDSGEITVWVAIGDVSQENGAMRFISGSHKHELMAHRDTFGTENQLTRGQELEVEVDESRAVTVELRSGEISIHHGRLFHASGPNLSGKRRIGIALRYITPSVSQVVGRTDYALLVRGEDRFGHFLKEPGPAFDLEPRRLAQIDEMLQKKAEFLFEGVQEKAPNYVVQHVS